MEFMVEKVGFVRVRFGVDAEFQKATFGFGNADSTGDFNNGSIDAHTGDHLHVKGIDLEDSAEADKRLFGFVDGGVERDEKSFFTADHKLREMVPAVGNVGGRLIVHHEQARKQDQCKT